jgi:hypothetical protein
MLMLRGRSRRELDVSPSFTSTLLDASHRLAQQAATASRGRRSEDAEHEPLMLEDRVEERAHREGRRRRVRSTR